MPEGRAVFRALIEINAPRLSAALVSACGALATLLAAIVPVRRALRLEPMAILRQE